MNIGVPFSAEILLRNKRVGWLDYFEEDITFRLEFDPVWLADPDREVLAQQFEDRLPRPIESTGLPLWFQWLLPQGPLLKFLERRHGLEPKSEFELLLALGEDLPGAVKVRVSPGRTAIGRRVHTQPPVAPGDPLSPSFSLSGAQWKFSARMTDRGLVIPTRGLGGSWIAKFHDPGYSNLPRVEHATALWARAAGIETPETRLANASEFVSLPKGVPTGDGSIFLSRRFDREPLTHMEDFAQILGRANYFQGTSEEVGYVLNVLCPGDLEFFVRQLVFCIICGNGDAHLKNWSVVYPNGKQARLSPAYDLIPTVLFMSDNLCLSIGGQLEFSALTVSHFMLLATLCEREISEVKSWIHDTSRRTHKAWRTCKQVFSESEVNTLEAHMASLTPDFSLKLAD